MAKNDSPKMRRNKVPAIKSGKVAQLHRPFTHEATRALAEKLCQFKEDLDSWKHGCRNLIRSGEAICTDFPEEKIPDINRGRMSLEARQIQVEDYNAAIDRGENPDAIPVCGGYNPVEREFLNLLRCPTVRVGRSKVRPENWDDREFGEWSPGLMIDNSVLCLCHAKDVTRQVKDCDRNIFTIGNHRYVVGTGGHEGSAAFLISSHTGGNRGNIDNTRKKMALSDADGLSDLVFRIEDGITDVVADEFVVTFMPGQVLTAGYLYGKDKKIATVSQIRAGDRKGLRFKKLKQPIYGTVTCSEQWEAIKQIEGEDFSEKNTLQNSETSCRINPGQLQPFGFRSVALNIIPYKVQDAEGNIEWGIVIGERSAFGYSVTKNEAKRELKESSKTMDNKGEVIDDNTNDVVEFHNDLENVNIDEAVLIENQEQEPEELNIDELLSDSSIEVDSIAIED